MLSIRPKWVEKIANGEKTIEVRKTRPKLDTPFKCYIYCSGGGDKLWVRDAVWRKRWINGPIAFLSNAKDCSGMNLSNGRVIGKFTCGRITNLFANSRFWLNENDALHTCLSSDEIRNYANGVNEIYGWHITDLRIYDKPHELGEFERPYECDECDAKWASECNACNEERKIKRPPQSWCYVEAMKDE